MNDEGRPGGISFLTSAVFFIASSIGLTVFFRSSATYEYGRETLAIVLSICGLWLLFFNSKTVSLVRGSVSRFSSDVHLSTLPAPGGTSTDVAPPSLPEEEKDDQSENRATSLRWILSLVLTISLASRLELFHQISIRSQCITWSAEGLVPFLVSLCELGDNQKRGQTALTHLLPSFLLMLASFLARLNDGYTSTYICPLVTHQGYYTTLMQIGAVILDVIILRGMSVLATASAKYTDLRNVDVAGLWAPVFLGAAAVEVIGQVCFVMSTDTSSSNASPGWLTLSIFVRALLFTLMCTSASQIVLTIGMSGVAFLYVFILADAAVLSQLLDGLAMFPRIPTIKAFFATVFLHSAAYLHHKTVTQTVFDGRSTRRRSIIVRSLMLVSLLFTLFLLTRQRGSSPYHPIDVLMERSAMAHKYWEIEARKSTNLEEAVLEYQRRYSRPPPPGFDKWYWYATNRSSLVIDDFDQIYNDLLPFAAISPAELRLLTADVISTPWNEVVAIHVRDGKASLQEGIKPTHKWMVKGVHKLIDNFVEHLPNMDIPLNINDEPRVAVPWEVLESMKRAGQWWRPDVADMTDKWSNDRSLPDTYIERRMFEDLGHTAIFDRIARPTCPPGSPVRTTHVRDKRHICLKCAAPHSTGQFLSRWALAGDICHQPDAVHLHGFYLSPSAFKVSQRLLPVFSQSRVSGFNDILYPSAWNYVDKVEYKKENETAWNKKYDTLFWRGATTEGHSQDGNWAGMIRQRFVHLVNNQTSNPVSVLLPSGSEQKTYDYVTMQGGNVQHRLGLNTSVFIADEISRSQQVDKEIQEQEFGVGGKLDFQTHWKYKYLFDTDGAAFSGRFLSFLQSGSLPLRTGYFRQWLDGRLSPWVHYVPIDIRLHGLWSTLAYFAGAKTPKGKVLMKPHDHEAWQIADTGRRWANQTLRKEDMEIYMFRLLLEWGRLTDDNRDNLGFSMPVEKILV